MTTDTGARNRLSFGQKPDATDEFDGKYDAQALLGGDIEAAFPHPEWERVAIDYWVDIQGSGRLKTWSFHVDSVLDGTKITLSWDETILANAARAVLVDTTTSETVNMKKLNAYTYTNDAPRDFTINTVVSEVKTTPAGEKPPGSAAGGRGRGKVARTLSGRMLKKPAGSSVVGLHAPTGLTVDLQNPTLALVKWKDNSNNETHFIIERKDEVDTSWREIAFIGHNTVTYTDTSIDFTKSSFYSYRVRAANDASYSKYSNTVTINK